MNTNNLKIQDTNLRLKRFLLLSLVNLKNVVLRK